MLGDLAALLVHAGEAEEALLIAAESVEIQRRLGFEQGVSLTQATQAYACLALGDHEQARDLLAESTETAHRLGYQHGLVYCLNGVAWLAYETGDLARAADAFGVARRLRREIGIDHDPDDVLVAHARSAVEARLGHAIDAAEAAELNLDELLVVVRS